MFFLFCFVLFCFDVYLPSRASTLVTLVFLFWSMFGTLDGCKLSLSGMTS